MKLLAVLFAVLTASASLSAVPHRGPLPTPSGALEGGYAQWAAGGFLHALHPAPLVQEKKHPPRADGPDGLAADAAPATRAAPAAGLHPGTGAPPPARGRAGPRFPTGPPFA